MSVCLSFVTISRVWGSKHTGRQALLELLGLLGVLQDKSVKVSLAADLELDLGVLRVLLDSGSYCIKTG